MAIVELNQAARLQELEGSIEARYARAGIGDWKTSEACRHPTWLGRMANYFLSVEESHLKPRERSVDVAAQIGDKLGMMSKSLRIATVEDIEELMSFRQSLIHFFPGLGFQNAGLKTDAKIFVDELPGLLEMGIDRETIAGWFRGVAGLACVDPTLFPQLFSARDTTRVIQPLEGVVGIKEEEDVSETWWEIERGMEEQAKTDVDLGLTRSAFTRVLRREKLALIKGAKGTLHNLRAFAAHCAAELKRKRVLAEERGEYWDHRLNRVIQAADGTSYFLERMREEGYRSTDILRPSSFGHVITPLAFGLHGRLSSRPSDRRNSLRTSLAGEMLAVLRRKRMALDRANLLSLCASFCFEERVDKNLLPEESQFYVGKGLKAVLDLEIRDPRLGNTCISEIGLSLLPEFVFRLRCRGFHTFEWTKDDYRSLGMDHLWERHNQKLKEVDRQVSGWTVVQDGDLILAGYGQYEVFTVAHEQLLEEVGRMSARQLIRGGLINRDFKGNTWVGVGVNFQSPRKQKREQPPEIRHGMIELAIQGMRASVFLYPPRDHFGPTRERIQTHLRNFKQRGINPLMARLTGTDALDPLESCYTRKVEEDGWAELNELPHVFALQRTDLGDFSKLGEKLRRLKEKFPRSLILLVPFPEVHTTDFIGQVGDLSDEVLATLIHPRNIQQVKELWGNEKK